MAAETDPKKEEPPLTGGHSAERFPKSADVSDLGLNDAEKALLAQSSLTPEMILSVWEQVNGSNKLVRVSRLESLRGRK